MLTIRLIKIGKKNSPSFRLVLTDKKNPPRGGRFLEILGNYNPRKKEINLKKERLIYWLAQGAKTSDTVHNLLVKQAIVLGPKIKKNIRLKRKTEEVKVEAGKEPTKEEIKEGTEKKEEPQAEPAKEQEAAKEEPAKPAKEPAKKEEPAAETAEIDKSEKEE